MHRSPRCRSTEVKPGAGGGDVVVAVHDVSPLFLDEIRWLLARLDDLGARPRVLKVIPNADGACLADCPALVDLLRNEQATGSEIVLHGWTHRAAGPARGPWHGRLRARLFAGTAAEFLTLAPDEMDRRLAAGQEMLRALGLETTGFCAPAWLALPALRPLLQERGFRYQIGLSTLDDLATGRRWTMAWLGYMGAGAAQEILIAAVGRVLLAAAPAAPAVKVFVHPPGAPASAACAAILRVLERLVRQRKVITYGQLLRQRSSR